MASRPFPVNSVMTAIAISYKNPAHSLSADKALPRQPVGASKFSWRRSPIGQAFTIPETQVGRRGRLNRVEFTSVEETGETFDYGLEDSIPISDINDAERMRATGLGSFDPEHVATETLTNLILLDREVRVAALMQNPSTYPVSQRLVLSGSDQLSNPNSDIIGTIKASFDKTLIVRPNTITMGRDVGARYRLIRSS